MLKTVKEKMRGRLTKKFYLEIPTGLFLVSNVGWDLELPAFAEKVVRHSEREAQWKKIVEFGADQRLCHVFKDVHDYKKWVSTIGMTTRLK